MKDLCNVITMINDTWNVDQIFIQITLYQFCSIMSYSLLSAIPVHSQLISMINLSLIDFWCLRIVSFQISWHSSLLSFFVLTSLVLLLYGQFLTIILALTQTGDWDPSLTWYTEVTIHFILAWAQLWTNSVKSCFIFYSS